VNRTLGKREVARKDDLKVWADKLGSFLDKQMIVYGYFGKYFSGFPPSDVGYLKSYLDS